MSATRLADARAAALHSAIEEANEAYPVAEGLLRLLHRERLLAVGGSDRGKLHAPKEREGRRARQRRGARRHRRSMRGRGKGGKRSARSRREREAQAMATFSSAVRDLIHSAAASVADAAALDAKAAERSLQDRVAGELQSVRQATAALSAGKRRDAISSVRARLFTVTQREKRRMEARRQQVRISLRSTCRPSCRPRTLHCPPPQRAERAAFLELLRGGQRSGASAGAIAATCQLCFSQARSVGAPSLQCTRCAARVHKVRGSSGAHGLCAPFLTLIACAWRGQACAQGCGLVPAATATPTWVCDGCATEMSGRDPAEAGCALCSRGIGVLAPARGARGQTASLPASARGDISSTWVHPVRDATQFHDRRVRT